MDQHQTINPLMMWFPPPLAPFPVCPPSHTDNIVNVGSGSIGGNPSPVKVTQVTTETYDILPTDYFLCVDTATFAVTLTLPTGKLGVVYIIKDCSGDAGINPITIIGSGGQVVDGSSATINSPYGSISVIFNGSEWSVV